ncbi:MAG TPA: cytochrome c-type biogenesis protein CcmH [Acidimicrobiales bacterium]|nr:cytochrome c-type biogenesis protein CcmH [Acidimicrobiales bacterium]
MRRALPALALAAVLVLALAVGSTHSGKPPTVTQRVHHIAKEVRCPTCQGLSADESDAPASEAIRNVIRDKVQAGQTDGQIRAFLVDRYGRDILLKPEAKGVGLIAWGLPVVGGVGALAGLVFAFRRWRKRPTRRVTDEERALVAAAEPSTEELAFLKASLTDLDRERAAGDIDEHDYAELQDDYTARAVALLQPPAPAPGPIRTTRRAPQRPQRRWLKPAAWTVLVAGLATVAGLLVAHTAGERVPGQAAAGSITSTGPSDQLAQARVLVGQRKVLDAIKLYDKVIAEDPKNAEALAYRGWLVRLTGKASNDTTLIDRGLEYVNRAVAADPSYPDAHFFKGEILLRDKQDALGAIPEFRAFLASNAPQDMATLVQGELQAALQAAGQAPPTTQP